MWPTTRFRHIADVTKGRLPGTTYQGRLDGQGLPYLTMDYLRCETDDVSLVHDDPSLLHASEGDILLLWDGANAGEFFRAKRGVVSSTCAMITPKEIDPRYLFWVCKVEEHRIRAATTGMGVPHVDGEVLGNLRVPVPSADQQRTIADYLDRETAQIDELIAVKRRLIGLLVEKRQALITKAVMRGLNQAAILRDSGNPWLGMIPKNWTATKLKYVASQPLAYGANEAASDDDRSWPRYVRITDINDDGTLREETFRSLHPILAGDYLLEDGDVLFARSGSVGKAVLYQESWGRSCFAGYLIRLRCDQRLVVPEFIARFAQSACYWRQLREGAIQSTIENFSADKYGELCLPLPPIEEQVNIIAALSDVLSYSDTLVKSAKRTIDLLKERRAALISEAVTGQIDVGAAT
ncbi:MAG: restriction endonuclease subunit S [Acidimicrobiia bacterium]|nr:restriction endonuclease subunit S [bacterium]MYE68202.1 restriction endonuclease subunit S [Acidimicrobiia bacterium]